MTSPPPDGSSPELPVPHDDATFTRTRLLRGWVVVVAGAAASKVIGLITIVLISRRLSVLAFGNFSFGVAYGAFFVFFADLGLDAITTRELAARPPEEEGRILGSAMVAKAVIVFVTLAISLGTLVLFRPGLRVVGAVSALGILSALPGTIILLLNARVRVLGATVVQVGASLATLAATMAAIRAGAGPVGLIWVQVVLTVLTGVVLAGLARRRAMARIEFHRPTLNLIIRGSVPVAVSLVGAVIYRRIDLLLLGGFGQVRQLALYAAAVRLVDALNIVPLAIATIALPTLAHLGSRETGEGGRAERVAQTGYRYLAAMIVPVAVLGTVAGGAVMAVTYGQPYRSAGMALALLLWAHVFGFTGVMVDQVLIARAQSRWLAGLTTAGALVNVAIDLWAIPRYGAIGAAWGSLVAYSVPFLLGLTVPAVRDVFVSCLRSWMRPVLAGGAMLVILATLGLPLRVLAVVFVPLAFAALVLSGSTTISELRDLASAVLRRGSGPDRPGEVRP
ncbi:MAG: flippase [Acidimicrobiales bacterium]